MSVCELSTKKPVVCNLVSHSNIKTKSRSKPNIQKKKLYSQALKSFFSFNVAASTVRDIEHKGGLDTYILKKPASHLSARALTVQKRIRKKLNTKSTAQKA